MTLDSQRKERDMELAVRGGRDTRDYNKICYQYIFLLVMCQHGHAAHRCCLCVAGGRQRRISPAKALQI